MFDLKRKMQAEDPGRKISLLGKKAEELNPGD